MRVLPVVRLVAAVSLCLLTGVFGSIVAAAEIPDWYDGLAKPFWTPPDFVYPIVWTTLYVLMGISLWRLWESEQQPPVRRTALALFFLQLALNTMWTPVFFGMHSIMGGLVVIVLLLFALVYTMLSALRVDLIAGWLLAPYLVWLMYASTLNGGVVALN